MTTAEWPRRLRAGSPVSWRAAVPRGLTADAFTPALHATRSLAGPCQHQPVHADRGSRRRAITPAPRSFCPRPHFRHHGAGEGDFGGELRNPMGFGGGEGFGGETWEIRTPIRSSRAVQTSVVRQSAAAITPVCDNRKVRQEAGRAVHAGEAGASRVDPSPACCGALADVCRVRRRGTRGTRTAQVEAPQAALMLGFDEVHSLGWR